MCNKMSLQGESKYQQRGKILSDTSNNLFIIQLLFSAESSVLFISDKAGEAKWIEKRSARSRLVNRFFFQYKITVQYRRKFVHYLYSTQYSRIIRCFIVNIHCLRAKFLMYGSDTAIGSFSQSYSDDSLWKSIHRDNSEE